MVKKVLSPEEQVKEAVQRIEPLGIPFCAVYVAMSKLHPDNRGYRQLEIVSKLFEPLLNHAQARLFLLSNNDFLLLTSNPVLDVIDDILYQIRSLFADDFFVSSHGYEHFQHIFFLDKDKDALMTLLEPPQSDLKKTEIQDLHSMPINKDLGPDVLENLIYQIEQGNTLPFVRRQTIIDLTKDGKDQEFGQEFYTSLLELQNTFAVHLNLSADSSLFATLMGTLDRKMLATFPEIKLRRYPSIISLNLNVESLFTPIFDKTIKSFPAQLMIEFQLADIVHNLPLYRKAYGKLKENNTLISLDAIGVNELECIPLSTLDMDYYKVFWTPKWNEPAHQKSLVQFVKSHADRVIMARSGVEEAIVCGKKVGISLFQGFYIDTLLSAVSKNACIFGQECNLNDCRLWRSALSADLRRKCVHEPHLDAYTPLNGEQV